MSHILTAPDRRVVRRLALEADCHERTALRALVYGVEAIQGYALRDRVRDAIARLAREGVLSTTEQPS